MNNEDLINELQASVNLCSFNDKNELEDFVKLRNKIDEILDSTIETKEGKTFADCIDQHISVIKRRAEGKKITIGDNLLDSIIPCPQAGIIVIGGYSGSMKSTYIHHLCKVRIAKHLPTTFINTELSEEGVMDSVTSSMIKENINDVMGMHDEDEHIDYSAIISKYENLKARFSNMNNFLIYPDNHISLAELKEFNRQARKKFGLKKDDLLVCFVDLLSMIEDFNKGSNRTDSIKLGMDKLNADCLEDNILLIGTLQLLRPQTVHIKKEEDLDKFRVSASALKDSSEWENRSRLVLSIFNRKNIVDKNPCDPIIRELTEPILDLTVLKNTYTNTLGDRIFYYIDTNYKSLIPYHNPDDDKVATTEEE